MKDEKARIKRSLTKLEKWLEESNYKGYDPADGLTSFLRPLTLGNIFMDRVLQQVIWKSPINLRPLLGVKKQDSFIGRGYIARAYLILFRLSGDEGYRRKATACLEWLAEQKAPGFEEHGWGKMFDFASRGGRQNKLEPITVWTSLIGLAFLDAYELLGVEEYLRIADSVCQWILKVPRTRTSSGDCINYMPYQADCMIHNQSMLAAAMLTRTWKHRGNEEYLRLAQKAIRFTCTRQLSDGSWLYGEEPKYHWNDSFHTAYNLDALKIYVDLTGDVIYQPHLRRGFSFYVNNFFEADGRPKYYHDKTYPIDSQCAAQAIDTLAFFSDYDDMALDLAVRVATWTIENMQDRDGHFYFRRYPFVVAKAPMIHWAQATTFKALANLLSRI